MKFKIGGIIGTIMRWDNWRWWIFNVALFAWQFDMLGAAKLIGEIFSFLFFMFGNWERDPEAENSGRTRLERLELLFRPFRDLSWAQIWKAAQWCHIRLVIGLEGDKAVCISFTAPAAKIEIWSTSTIINSKGHFVYLDPNFEVTEDESLCLMESGQRREGDPIKRRYDYLQLGSFIIHLPIWIIGTILGFPCWGIEYIKMLNLPKREVCSTGAASLLKNCIAALARAFNPFVIAMVSPCVFPINRKWGKA